MFRKDLIARLEEVALGIQKARTRIYADKGLHAGQARVISALLEYGDLSQADLARLIDIAAPTVKRLIEGLQKNSLVKLQTSGKDRRIQVVSLTRKGRAQSKVLKECTNELAQLVCQEFSEPEIIMTGLLMTRISENLKSEKE